MYSERNIMRQLLGKRWALIGFLAAGIIALTVQSASAAVVYNATVPDGSLIVGPGCYGSLGAWTAQGDWHPAGGDYYGFDAYQNLNNATGTCDGTSVYTLDQATATASVTWWLHFGITPTSTNGVAFTQNCQIYAYIPTEKAGDYHARYDFYGFSYTTIRWLAWPGDTIDQEDNAGWTHIGSAIVPPGTSYLQVVLNNGDPATPGWYAGAGDMAFDCNPA